MMSRKIEIIGRVGCDREAKAGSNSLRCPLHQQQQLKVAAGQGAGQGAVQGAVQYVVQGAVQGEVQPPLVRPCTPPLLCRTGLAPAPYAKD